MQYIALAIGLFCLMQAASLLWGKRSYTTTYHDEDN